METTSFQRSDPRDMLSGWANASDEWVRYIVRHVLVGAGPLSSDEAAGAYSLFRQEKDIPDACFRQAQSGGQSGRAAADDQCGTAMQRDRSTVDRQLLPIQIAQNFHLLFFAPLCHSGGHAKQLQASGCAKSCG